MEYYVAFQNEDVGKNSTMFPRFSMINIFVKHVENTMGENNLKFYMGQYVVKW